MTAYWRFRLLRSFFGLSEDDAEYIYEEIFQLKHHGGWSFIEAYNLPLLLRKWFLRRLKKQFDDEAAAADKAFNKSKRS